MADTEILDGTWHLTVRSAGRDLGGRLALKIKKGKVETTLCGLAFGGIADGREVAFVAITPDNGSERATFTGRLEHGDLTGTGRLAGIPMTWTACRIIPKLHVFEPQTFHLMFSGNIEPALRIKPGDTVQTATIDNSGRDNRAVQRCRGGNPLTGPFYVEGAGRGDTLVVMLNQIRPNRDMGRSGNRISLDAVTTNYARTVRYVDPGSRDWTFDREAGIARLTTPSERLKRFQIPLHPFLGCVGVAPPDRQAFGAKWLGPWGGNLDYRNICEGTTLFLPIFQEGALLFLGDGHAAQGDGELTGDALETSMDVAFTVELISATTQKASSGPRAESDEYLMTMGIAGSISEALRIATTNLATWLEGDYRFNAHESALVLGMSIRYDIAVVVNPMFNVVAKVEKSLLTGLSDETVVSE